MGCCCDCVSSVIKKILVVAISLVKIACVVAILIIVSNKLYNVDVTFSNTSLKTNVQCLMGDNYNGTSLCEYIWAVCGLSLVASLVLTILLCCTCDLCGLGDWLQFAFSLFMTGWWAIASAIFAKNGKDANDKDVPMEDYRNTVIILCFVVTGLFAVLTLVYLVECVKCLKNCLCCCCSSDKDKYSA